MAGDYMYYSDGNNVWPLGQYLPGMAAGCVYEQPTTSVVSNWMVCPLCSCWYLLGTSHQCATYGVVSDQKTRTPHKCPSCDGYGEREPRGSLWVNTATVPCVSCGGKGVLWE